ncbi:hypothetical protein [Tumebacillus permanentifrigoris]|uniref:Uncharacterized protein n=1 Tax=Tumebacillus permanentifrigoris TaxID=378543 RepID=A0A316D6W7_9BACL|nr:hypothetical protein [Tumebacillus permanentifrigoris]PWK05056.1 hypothetical protein C7459_12827 [Tumebacillus permanentifrigoris]
MLKLRNLVFAALLVVVSATFTGCGGNMASHEMQGMDMHQMNMHE